MTDSYQPFYDAARRALGSVDVDRALQNAFDISHARAMLQEQISTVGYEMARPSTIFRPRIYIDGDQWCALYGENLQDGVAGFGDSPANAMYAFDNAWNEKLKPRASKP